MDALDYFERETKETFATLRGDYKEGFERLYKLLAALIVGSVAAGGYAVDRFAHGLAGPVPPALSILWHGAACVAVGWLLAAGVAAFGMRPRSLSDGPTRDSIDESYRKHRGSEGDPASEAERLATRCMRWDELHALERASHLYRAAITSQAEALLWATLMAVGAVGLATAVVALRLKGLF